MIFVPKLHKVRFEISTDFMRLNKKRIISHSRQGDDLHFPQRIKLSCKRPKGDRGGSGRVFGESKCLVPALPRNPDLSLQDLNEIVQICDKVLECFLESNLSVFNI